MKLTTPGILAALVAIVGTIVGALKYIDDRIDRQLEIRTCAIVAERCKDTIDLAIIRHNTQGLPGPIAEQLPAARSSAAAAPTPAREQPRPSSTGAPSTAASSSTSEHAVVEGVSHGSERRGCMPLGDQQLCWGFSELHPRNKPGEPLADFSFSFLLPFEEMPTIATGINAKTSGYAYAVYGNEVTKTSFSGTVLEVLRRQSAEPIVFNYMAVGRGAVRRQGVSR